jgi:DHA1 family tetracycline resistance protein-like MFS transporter
MPARSSKSSVVFIFVAVLIDVIGFGIIIPVLPDLIMELTGEGISRAAIYGGWLGFAYAVMQFFAASVLGNVSDSIGRRPVILFSLGALGVDYVVMGLAPSLPWLFLGRAFAGIAGASFIPAYAYLADVTPPEKRAQNFGLVGAAFGIGFIIGPAIGGLLGGLGTRTPFFAAAALALANTTFGYFVLPESLAKESRRPFTLKRANPLGALWQIQKYPVVLGLAAAIFLWQIAHQVFPSTWSYYTMLRFHWSEAMVGASLAFIGAIMAISQGVMSRTVLPVIGERRTAMIGLTCAVLAHLGYAFATRGWMMFALLVPWLFAGLVYPSMNAIMSREVPANAQGELQGAVATLFSLALIVSPPVMTQLFGHFSAANAPVHFPGAAFAFASLLTSVSAAVFVRATRTVVVRQAEVSVG